MEKLILEEENFKMEKVILTEEDVLGKGTNKICYFYPGDNTKCIKFSLDVADEKDLNYELRFRKICENRIKSSTLLTKYYGVVQTNKGIGYVFEVVRDFDGKISETFLSFVCREKDSSLIQEILADFRQKMFAEAVVTYKIFLDNILVQRITEREMVVRIIDGIGMHVLFPLPYYSKFLTKKHQQKIWNDFMKKCSDEYGLNVPLELKA